LLKAKLWAALAPVIFDITTRVAAREAAMTNWSLGTGNPGTAKLVQIVGDRRVTAGGAAPGDIDFSEFAIEPFVRWLGEQVGVPARQKA
jgi:hypothetical protein